MFLIFPEGSSLNREENSEVEFLLPSVFVVRERAQQTNIGMWKMKAQIRVLRDSHGSTRISPGGVHYGW